MPSTHPSRILLWYPAIPRLLKLQSKLRGGDFNARKKSVVIINAVVYTTSDNASMREITAGISNNIASSHGRKLLMRKERFLNKTRILSARMGTK